MRAFPTGPATMSPMPRSTNLLATGIVTLQWQRACVLKHGNYRLRTVKRHSAVKVR